MRHQSLVELFLKFFRIGKLLHADCSLFFAFVDKRRVFPFSLQLLFFAEHKPHTAKFHGFRVSKFKHLSGKPSKRACNIENIKNYDQSLSHESDGLQAFNDLVAYPIAGPGGQIAVVKVRNLLKQTKL